MISKLRSCHKLIDELKPISRDGKIELLIAEVEALQADNEQLQAEVESKDKRIAKLEAGIANAIESLENALDWPAAGVLEQLLNKEASDDSEDTP